MLVLKRKRGTKIYVGPDIRITIIDCSFHSVRVGIEAPLEINVLRDDVDDAEAQKLVMQWAEKMAKKGVK